MTKATVALLLQTLRLHGAIAPAEAHAAWSAARLRGLQRLLAYEGAQLWLYRRLRSLGASAPYEFMRQLRTDAQRLAVQALRADAQTASAITMLEEAGIPCALIKGQARRAAIERYPYADARGVMDVDLLLPEARATEGWNLLLQHRYERCYPGPTPWTISHHLPTLWDENRVAVELHLTTTNAVPAGEAWRRATEACDQVTWGGKSVAVPNATELLWQAVSHALRDGSRGYRLSAFLNATAVLAPDPPIDWEAIEARIAAGEIADPEKDIPVPARRIHQWLNSAAELAGQTLPPALALAGCLNLERVLLWRSKVLKSGLSESVQERLLEEGTRHEVGMALSPPVEGTGAVPRARRRTASLIARMFYAGWRH